MQAAYDRLRQGESVTSVALESGYSSPPCLRRTMALPSWLKVLGLTDKGVITRNMDQLQAPGAFENGTDGVALWAPHLYVGEATGWKLAGDIKNCGHTLPIVIQADKKHADAHPEAIAAFLLAWMRGVHTRLKNEAPESLVPLYRRFFAEWAGQPYTPEVALKDIKTHPVFDYQEQRKLLGNSKGMGEAQQWQRYLPVSSPGRAV